MRLIGKPWENSKPPLITSERAYCRALIITGAGDKSFVAGADIHELQSMSAIESARLSARGQAIFRCLEVMKKPSIAAINGFALGAGLELAMACTLRVAVATARVGAAGTQTRVNSWLWRDAAARATNRARKSVGVLLTGRQDRRRSSMPYRTGEPHISIGIATGGRARSSAHDTCKWPGSGWACVRNGGHRSNRWTGSRAAIRVHGLWTGCCHR